MTNSNLIRFSSPRTIGASSSTIPPSQLLSAANTRDCCRTHAGVLTKFIQAMAYKCSFTCLLNALPYNSTRASTTTNTKKPPRRSSSEGKGVETTDAIQKMQESSKEY